MLKILIRFVSVFALMATILSCSKDSDSKSPGPEKISSKAIPASVQDQLLGESIDRLACADVRTSLFESLQKYILKDNSIPSVAKAEELVALELNAKYSQLLAPEKIAAIVGVLHEFYKTSLEQVPQEFKISAPIEIKKTLGALKVGDRSLPEAQKLQTQYKKIFNALKLELADSSLKCVDASVEVQASNVFPYSEMQARATETKTPLTVLGLRRAFATAYQSCESLKLDPMTRSTPAIEGVVVTGSYPGGGGDMRKISDQEALARTHYYVKGFAEKPGCIDVKKQTMIYDYGGKPYTTSNPNSTLNYWKNNGDGSPGLGIDCSGYVFSSLAAGGLRLVKGQRLKASEVEDYPARMYIEAADNGFTCLESAKVGKNFDLRPGDIVATKYHIIMIESVGKDPLAIRKYDDCSKISYMDFDFVIAQSSPEQNAVGINKYSAKEYLKQKIFNPIQYGFVSFARAACEAYQANQDVTPSSSSFGVTRHKLTAECLQPEVQLVGSACIDSCTELFNR